MAYSIGKHAMPSETAEDSIALRLLRYERSQKLCNYLGGGIGGILVIVGLSSNAITNAPWQLVSATITLAVFSAVCLGLAYIGFLSASFNLVRHQKREKLDDGEQVPDNKSCLYPENSFVAFKASVILLILAGMVLLAGLWFQPNVVEPAPASPPVMTPPTPVPTVPTVTVAP